MTWIMLRCGWVNFVPLVTIGAVPLVLALSVALA